MSERTYRKVEFETAAYVGATSVSEEQREAVEILMVPLALYMYYRGKGYSPKAAAKKAQKDCGAVSKKLTPPV